MPNPSDDRGESKAIAAESLWVSFVGRPAKYLMRIDALGNILLPPTRIAEIGSFREADLTALSVRDSRTLNYWYISNSKEHTVFRLVIDKISLRTLKLVETKLDADFSDNDSTLDVTNRIGTDFISFPRVTLNGLRLAAFPLDQLGRVVGQQTFLTPEISGEFCGQNPSRCKAGTSDDHDRRFYSWCRPRVSSIGYDRPPQW